MDRKYIQKCFCKDAGWDLHRQDYLKPAPGNLLKF